MSVRNYAAIIEFPSKMGTPTRCYCSGQLASNTFMLLLLQDSSLTQSPSNQKRIKARKTFNWTLEHFQRAQNRCFSFYTAEAAVWYKPHVGNAPETIEWPSVLNSFICLQITVTKMSCTPGINDYGYYT